ncbi:MAG: exported protein of unknown function [Candidatus Saccharibacteria bacterium]|jgi:prepilin-type N-terminal cleavage/methylation domain-containing protein|nr:exported protein of unknown function [Candidatus Saccharibacteria bacterium]
MTDNMKKPSRGFTIIELLIVIVVVGILASITIVAFNGIQTKAANMSKTNEAVAWKKLLEVYKATYDSYPPVPIADYCLGSGFPDGDGIAGGECRDYQLNSPTYTYHENDNAALMAEIKKVGKLPTGDRTPISGIVGPYMGIWPTGYIIITILKGGASDCPAPTYYVWDNGNGVLLCALDS